MLRTIFLAFAREVVTAKAPTEMVGLLDGVARAADAAVRALPDTASVKVVATHSDNSTTVARTSMSATTSGSSPATSRPRPEKRSRFDDGRRAKQDSVGLYLEEISRYRRLSREEEVSYSRDAREGDKEAQDILVRHNLRLVVAVCKDFTRDKFPLLELVSAGNEGLIVASQKFDGEMGVPFANYAAYWIKQRVMKHIAEHGFSVRVPPYRAAIVNKVIRVHRKLMQELGREPSPQDVAMETETSVGEVREVLRILQPAMELDAPLTREDETTTFGAYFGESTDEADEREEATLEDLDLGRAVAVALETLDEREGQILRWHYGLGGRMALDLDQIAERLGVTRERVRQIRSAALKKLEKAGGLDGFLV